MTPSRLHDSLQTVVAVMDTVEGLTAATSRPLVKNPADVTRRVTQAYADQGLPVDADHVSAGMMTRAQARARQKEEGAGFFSLGTAPDLTELGLVLGILLVGVVTVLMVGPTVALVRNAQHVGEWMQTTVALPMAQATATWRGEDAQSYLEAVKGRVRVTEDLAHRPVITLTVPNGTAQFVGSALMKDSAIPIEVWAQGHRVTRTDDLLQAFACSGASACAALGTLTVRPSAN